MRGFVVHDVGHAYTVQFHLRDVKCNAQPVIRFITGQRERKRERIGIFRIRERVRTVIVRLPERNAAEGDRLIAYVQLSACRPASVRERIERRIAVRIDVIPRAFLGIVPGIGIVFQQVFQEFAVYEAVHVARHEVGVQRAVHVIRRLIRNACRGFHALRPIGRRHRVHRRQIGNRDFHGDRGARTVEKRRLVDPDRRKIRNTREVEYRDRCIRRTAGKRVRADLYGTPQHDVDKRSVHERFRADRLHVRDFGGAQRGVLERARADRFQIAGRNRRDPAARKHVRTDRGDFVEIERFQIIEIRQRKRPFRDRFNAVWDP